jgi:dienelactone hydrolase
MTRLGMLLSLLIGLVPCGPSTAIALDEMVEIGSLTMSEGDFLRGDAAAGTPVTLSGRLEGPDTGEPLPVVILLHGTDGPKSGAVRHWSRFLNTFGIATLSLDSYTGRHLGDASADQSRFGQFSQIYDTYRAVEALAANPKIDGARVAVMGFSRGGNAALYSAMARFQKAFGPANGRIVAHLPFYPACNFELVDQLNTTGAPIREFHGTDDDWTPAAPCRVYVERLRAAGRDARMIEYPGALHGFDSPSNPSWHSDPGWQTSRSCLRREENAQLVNTATGKPFTYADACVEYGPSVKFDAVAAADAQEAVKVFLAEVFRRQ